MSCQVVHFNTLDYQLGLEEQQKRVSAIQSGIDMETLFLLQHPHVITLGRGKEPRHLLVDVESLSEKGIEFFETGRGGDITYHGPGQLIGYPILKLTDSERDVRKYMGRIEEVIIRTLSEFDIEAGRIDGLTGVWVGDEKIAAIGVRLSRWITSHGFALNVNPDLSYFNLITPCGISGKGVTSMAKILGRDITVKEVENILVGKFSEIMEREILDNIYVA